MSCSPAGSKSTSRGGRAAPGAAARLVQVGTPVGLLRPGRRGWDAALAQLVATPTRTRVSVVHEPYLRDDPVVLVRRGLKRPTSLAQLRTLVLCAERGRRAADTAADARPAADPSAPRHWSGVPAPSSPDRACDAAVAELSRLGPALDGRRDLFGGLAGRIETERAYAVALERGARCSPRSTRPSVRCVPTGHFAA